MGEAEGPRHRRGRGGRGLKAPCEVTLEPGTRIVADLHLDLAAPDGAAPLVALLARLRREAVPRLVVLGDLFDYWVGPAQARLAGARAAFEALRAFTAAGAALDVALGNRDFLLDARFCALTGAVLRRDGLVGVLPGGARALLVHGDELCTLDHGYQRLRAVLRSAPVRALGPRLPLWAGTALARRLRRASTRALRAKPVAEKSIQSAAAAEFALRHDCAVVLCGHAHEALEEALPGGARLLVLDAFGGPRGEARVGADGSLALGG